LSRGVLRQEVGDYPRYSLQTLSRVFFKTLFTSVVEAKSRGEEGGGRRRASTPRHGDTKAWFEGCAPSLVAWWLRPKAFSGECNIYWAYAVLHLFWKPPSPARARLLGVCEALRFSFPLDK